MERTLGSSHAAARSSTDFGSTRRMASTLLMMPGQASSRLLARNALVHLLGQSVPLMVGFFAIPFIIGGLGEERFGILSLAWVAVLYMTVFDLGLGRATTKFVADAHGREKDTVVRHLVWTATLAQSVLGVAGMTILAASAPVLVDRVLQLPEPLSAETKKMFYVLALSAPLLLISLTFRGALEAAQRFDLVNSVRAPSSAANFLLPLVGIAIGLDLAGIVGLLVAANALTLAAYFWLAAGVFPALRQGIRFDSATFRHMIKFGGWITVSDLIGPVLVYLDRFVLGALLPIRQVAFYTAPFEAVTRVWIIPASILAPLFPVFSTFGDRRETGPLEAAVGGAMRLVLLVVGAVAILLVVNAREILHLWLGESFAQRSTLVFQVLTLAILINSLAQVLYSFVQALGRPDVTAKFHLIELPFYVVVLVILVSLLGLTGAAIAWFLRVVADALLLSLAARRIASATGISLGGNELVKAAFLLAMFTIMITLVANLVRPLWLEIALSSTALTLYALAAWREVLQPDLERVGVMGGP